MMNEHHFSSITYLMPQLKIGDEEAWNNLCDKFRIGLAHRARKFITDSKITSALNADDLVQESLLKAWNQIGKFNGSTTAQFAAWLFKIIRNTFLDWCKSPKHKSASAGSIAWFDFEDMVESPSKIVINTELESRLYACLAELNPPNQEAIILRHFDGLKFNEIAERMKINANTAASHYRRGIATLKQQLDNVEQ